MRAWMPGEWQRENIDENNVDSSRDNVTAQTSPRCSQNDDASSVASGISNMLSLSPILGGTPRSSKRKGPKYDILPPYIVDAQLVTKKVGKECQRMVLIRIYRVQDVARAALMGGEEETNDEEAYDVIAPLDSTGGYDGGSALGDEFNHGSVNQQNNHGVGGGKAAVAPIDPLLESKRSLKALQEASALVQRIKAVGGSGFAIDPPPLPMLHSDGGGDTASVTSRTSTKSYFKSFGDAITSPIRYFGGSNSAVSPMKTSSLSPYPTVMELMSTELLRKHISSPSVGTTSKSALAAAKQKSHGIFPALSMEDAPYVKSSWIFLRDCIEELDRRCLAYR